MRFNDSNDGSGDKEKWTGPSTTIILVKDWMDDKEKGICNGLLLDPSPKQWREWWCHLLRWGWLGKNEFDQAGYEEFNFEYIESSMPIR